MSLRSYKRILCEDFWSIVDFLDWGWFEGALSLVLVESLGGISFCEKFVLGEGIFIVNFYRFYFVKMPVWVYGEGVVFVKVWLVDLVSFCDKLVISGFEFCCGSLFFLFDLHSPFIQSSRRPWKLYRLDPFWLWLENFRFTLGVFCVDWIEMNVFVSWLEFVLGVEMADCGEEVWMSDFLWLLFLFFSF